MINTSRRMFLFGSAAALAAASMPFAVKMVTPSELHFVQRTYFEFGINGIGEQPPGARTIDIRRRNADLPIFSTTLDNRAEYRWVAIDPFSKIIVPQKRLLQIDVTGGGNLEINLGFCGRLADGSERNYREKHTFPSRGPATIILYDDLPFADAA